MVPWASTSVPGTSIWARAAANSGSMAVINKARGTRIIFSFSIDRAHRAIADAGEATSHSARVEGDNRRRPRAAGETVVRIVVRPVADSGQPRRGGPK